MTNLAALITVTFAAGGLTLFAAMDAIPTIAFVWQVVAIATFLGAIAAYRRKRRDPDYDHFSLIVRWSVAGFVVGVVIALIDALA